MRKHQNEQADARDGSERVSRIQIIRRERTETDREIFVFPVELTTSRIGNLTRLIHTRLFMYIRPEYVMVYSLGDIHPYNSNCSTCSTVVIHCQFDQ